MAFSVSSKRRGGQDGVVMDWLRRQPSARVSTCMEGVCSASHCLAQDSVGFWFHLNSGHKFRVGFGFFKFCLMFLQM